VPQGAVVVSTPPPLTPLPPHCRRTAAGHRSPTSSEKRRCRAGFLPLTVDEELRELSPPSPCPAGSLTIVGARPPPFAPPPPLWHRRQPCRDVRLGAVTASALRCAVAGRTGRGQPGERRPRAAHTGRAPRGRGPRTRCACGPSRRCERGPRVHYATGLSAVSA
jgi:hypothetical protein